MTSSKRRIMMVAGEPSGDLHAACLAAELQKRYDHLEIFGMGGEQMRRAGAEVIHDIAAHGVIGFLDVPKAYFQLRKIRNDLVRRVRRSPPDVVIMVDYPGFNLAVAGALKKLPDPPRLAYFITPQVWAWWEGRSKKIARLFDFSLSIYPFEPAYFQKEGGRAVYVGNPLAYALRDFPSREQSRESLGIPEGGRTIALFPGSRMKEIERLLPPMAGAARRLREKYSDAFFAVSEAEALPPGTVAGRLSPDERFIHVVRGSANALMRAADAAVLASGTAALETALLETPMVVVYAGDRLSYFLVKYFLLKVDYISLVNLMSGKGAVPELYQADVRPEKIAALMIDILENPGLSSAQKEAFARVRSMLSEKNPYAAAADHIRDMMESFD
ncbi:MAG: lipid-A-disaccharide synthase [bacterium]|nr:lipid-A-disaccharide synthase [bacterium]